MVVDARPRLAVPAAIDAHGTLVVALVLAAAACAITGSAWTLLVSPIAFGVPHVIADVNYLLVRGPRSLRASAILAIAMPLAILIGLRGMAVTGGAPSSPTVEVALGVAAIVAAAAILAPRARPIVAAGIVAVCVAAVVAPRAATVVLLHGHNAIAVAIWLGWASTRVRPAVRIAIVGVAAVVIALIAAGAADSFAPGGPLDRDVLARTLAPGLAPIGAARVVAIFAFLQAVHYVMWLVAIPHGLARGRTWNRRTLAMLGAATLILPVLAIGCDAVHVRELYLGLVTFHAWLELAIAGYLVVARDRLA